MRLVGPPLARPDFATVTEALLAAAKGDDGITLVDAREEETFVPYRELLSSSQQIAGALVSRGVSPGDRVALILPTGRDFLDTFFGIQLAGAVPVPLYPPVRLGRMDEYARSTARMLTVSGACALVTDRKVKLLLGQAVHQARPRLGTPTAAELREEGRRELRQVEPSSLGLVQFSSGSTVDPKPVALSQANLLAQCAALRALLDRKGPAQVGVSWLPLYHDMGLIGCLLTAVYYGKRLVLLPPEVFLARPALWLRAISRHRAAVSPAPNFAYGLCLKRVREEELKSLDLSSWAFALNGAEPVSAELLRRFSERFAPCGFRPEALLPVYGLSESSLAVTFPSGHAPARVLCVDAEEMARSGKVRAGQRELVSVGSPVPGAEVEVRDEHGNAVGPRQIGRVWTRSPSVMVGYLGNQQATREALVEGWLDTGDLGFLDEGELFLCGRAKDLIIVRGANHAPQEFEECLDRIDGVRTGCVVAVGHVPPGSNEEQLLLLVEAIPGAPSDLAARVSTTVLEHTGINPWKVELLAPGTLPRTSSGKLRRGLALRQYIAGELAPPGAVNALTMTREIARSALGFVRTRLS